MKTNPINGNQQPTDRLFPARPAGRRIAVATALVAASLFALLGLAAHGDRVVPGDVRLGRLVQSWRGDIPETLATVGNALGSASIGVPFAILVATVFAVRRDWWPVYLLVGAALARILTQPLKRFLASPRPTDDILAVSQPADGFGYPSGHSNGAMVLFGSIAIILLARARTKRQRHVAAGLMLLLLVSGFARVHVGAHWPSDVLGGFLLGTVILATLVALRSASDPRP